MSGTKCTACLLLHITAILTNVRAAKPGIEGPGDEGRWKNNFVTVHSALQLWGWAGFLKVLSVPRFHDTLDIWKMAIQAVEGHMVLFMPPGSTWGAARFFSQTLKRRTGWTCRMIPQNGEKGEIKPFNLSRACMSAEGLCSPWASATAWAAPFLAC